MSSDKAALAAIEHLYHELGTGRDGLSNQEADLRLKKSGPNILPRGKKANLVERFLIQFKNMFNILLLIASFLSFVSGIAYDDAGSFQMGLAILSVVFLNAFFSLFQEYRAERAVQVISVLIPKKTKVLREGQVKEVDVTDVVPGDVLALEEGDRVPADAICVEFSIMAAIIYVPFLQPLFGTAPLLLSDWLFLSILAPLAFLLEKFTKISITR